MKENNVYIAVGSHASGKSTWWDIAWWNGHLDPRKFIRINFEDIRMDLLGDETDISSERAVETIAYANYKQALSNRIENIYWDHTSHTIKKRKVLIDLAKKAGYKVFAVYFDISKKECQKRNQSRDRVVKEDIFNFVWNSINKNPPQLEEGFYDIITVSE